MGKADLAQFTAVRKHIEESLRAAFGTGQVLYVESRTKPGKRGSSHKRGTA
jgi:hypothetical protein